MAIELRPLRLSEILDRMFHLYRERFLIFFGIAGASTLLELIWSAGQLGLSWQLKRGHPGPTLQIVGTCTSLVGWVISVGTAALTIAAINRAVLAIFEGKPTGIAKAYGELRGHWLTCIWVSVLGFLIAFSPFLVVGLGASFTILLAKGAKTLTAANAVTSVYGFSGLAALIALPLCVWLMLRYSLAIPASIQERISTLSSLKRSVILSHGSRGRIFVLLLVVVVAWYIPLTILMIPTFFIILKNGGHVAPLSAAIYTLGVSFLVNMLMKPIYGIGLTLLYLDERIRKEGYDVEWMMEHTKSPETMAQPESLLGPAPSPDRLISG
jgi:hypothetical protein